MTAEIHNMLLDDPIYGCVELHHEDDALLIDLIQSTAVQRLKHVLQHGISAIEGLTLCGAAVTRFSHSVGACLLVRRLGANVECQAAALLHDIAHTSLSHTVDFAFNRVVHETDKFRYLESTTIPRIIAQYGLNPATVLEEANYTLLERDAPALCADRLDYGLRDCFAFGILHSPHRAHEVQTILDDITDYKGEIVCQTTQGARLLSDAYMEADRFAWSNPTHAVLYKYAAEAIKEAYDLGQITLDDLWTTCEAFWRSLRESPLSTVRAKAERVRHDLAVEELAAGSTAKAGTSVLELELKPRTLDPTVLIAGMPQPLSSLDVEYARNVVEYRASKKGRRRFQVTRHTI